MRLDSRIKKMEIYCFFPGTHIYWSICATSWKINELYSKMVVYGISVSISNVKNFVMRGKIAVESSDSNVQWIIKWTKRKVHRGYLQLCFNWRVADDLAWTGRRIIIIFRVEKKCPISIRNSKAINRKNEVFSLLRKRNQDLINCQFTVQIYWQCC